MAAKGDTVRTISACKVERQGPLVTVTVTAEGPDEDSAISAMEQLFKENL